MTSLAVFDYSRVVRPLLKAGLRMADIAELTDRQIAELFREQDEPEAVQLPGDERPPSKDEERALLFGFGQMVGMSTEDLEATWKAKYPEG